MRLKGLDITRGLAILLMVIYHFSFDLNNFHIIDLDIKHGVFWKYFRYIIVSTFVFLAGVSLYIAHNKKVDFKKLKKRVLILSGASLLVSIGSYAQFPNTWIYFGILHFFLFTSIAGLLFLRIPKISFFLGLFIIIGSYFSVINMHWLYDMLKHPLHLPLGYTEDLANIFPWFGVFLLGVSFASYDFHHVLFKRSFFTADSLLNRFFLVLGKNSLLIYLIHQPILFGIFFIFQR